MCNIFSRYCIDCPYHLSDVYICKFWLKDIIKHECDISRKFLISISDIRNKMSVDLQYSPITVVRE